VEIDLLVVVDAITTAGIDQLAAAAVAAREVADIFDEEKRALGELLLQDQCRLVGELRIGEGVKKLVSMPLMAQPPPSAIDQGIWM
jgi:hypothetical protein